MEYSPETVNPEIFENTYVKFWMEDGIMFGKYKPGITIDLEVAKEVAAERIKLANGRLYSFVGFIEDLQNVTKEARDYFSQDDGVKGMKRLALITASPISKMFGNFFLKISKPSVPTRLFTSEPEALIWLREETI